MLDAETLMRYIRIFSELSNQIRYASQKRVLVEIALIKLCQPVMETNLDSLFDRIRVLEEKLENGVVMAGPAQAGEYGSPAYGGVPDAAGGGKTFRAGRQSLRRQLLRICSILRRTGIP